MRARRLVVLGILVGVVALTAGSLGSATSACAGRLSCLGFRLPAPVTISTGRVTYRIGRDGRVRRVPTASAPIPAGADVFPATGTWYEIQHGHLVVGLGRRPLWRSHEPVTSQYQIGVVMASSHLVAFQHDHKLFLADLPSAERPVATREMPLGWTSGGFYTYRYQGQQLVLRSDTGRLLKVVARQPLGSDYYVASGTLYFIAHGALMSAHGVRVRRLASLARLGLSAGPELQAVGRLIELEDDNWLMVLRPDGSVFAWMSLRDWRAETFSSSLVIAPDGSAVAFVAASGETGAPDTQHSYGIETVYLLRAGTHTAIPLHRELVEFALCSSGAGLDWRGRWLLYSETDGDLSLIDTAGARRTLELSRLGRSLAGAQGSFSAYWSGQPPEL